MKIQIQRVRRGSVTKFRPTINGRPCGKYIYARKYDAVSYLRALVKHYGEEKLSTLFKV